MKMTAKALKSSLGLAALVALSLSRPIHAETLDPEYRESLRRGNSEIRTGKTLLWTGTALLPISALALVPVLYDGAFGITAADPGFAVYFALAGLGLIHAGIPLYGLGVSDLEKAAGGAAPEGSESAESGWAHYRRSWKFVGGGAAVLAAAFPFAIVAALEGENKNKPLDYTVEAMGITGIGLLAAGALEQYYSLHRFVKASDDARDRLRQLPQVSLYPYLRMDRKVPGAGMLLTCSF
jgi:hypothetical protein